MAEMRFLADWKLLVHLAKTEPDLIVKVGEWPGRKMNAAEGRRYMQAQVNAKIDQWDERGWIHERTRRAQHVSYQDGRQNHFILFKKYADPAYLGDLAADRETLHTLRTTRIRIYQFRTKYYRQKYGHLLAQRDD